MEQEAPSRAEGLAAWVFALVGGRESMRLATVVEAHRQVEPGATVRVAHLYDLCLVLDHNLDPDHRACPDAGTSGRPLYTGRP